MVQTVRLTMDIPSCSTRWPIVPVVQVDAGSLPRRDAEAVFSWSGLFGGP